MKLSNATANCFDLTVAAGAAAALGVVSSRASVIGDEELCLWRGAADSLTAPSVLPGLVRQTFVRRRANDPSRMHRQLPTHSPLDASSVVGE